MHRTRSLAAAAGLTAGLLASTLSGCAALSGADQQGTQIATAFYPVQYVAQRVAGPLAQVDNLTQPGAEPHDVELSIKETAEVANADLVVYERGFQPSVDAAVDQNATGRVVDAGAVVGLEAYPNGDPNPHFWQDPLRMAAVGDELAHQLGAIDPAHADTFTANAAHLRHDLERLDAAYRSGLAHCERHTLVVSHDAFGYLEKYGLQMAPIAGLSPDAEPTPADLAELQELIRDDGITTVFSERLAPPRLSQSLADDMGITTAVLDPIEGLSDATTHENYLSLMRENLTALEQANGCR